MATNQVKTSSNSNLRLPIHADEALLEKNPKFCQLLHIISNKLTSDGITLVKKHEVEKAEKSLRISKQGWLTHHIPFYELREMITELEVKSAYGNLSLQIEQLTGLLSDSVIFSELPDYLPLPGNTVESHNILGIPVEDFDSHNQTKQHLPTIQKVVLPMLEDRLVYKCQKLHKFFDTRTEDDTDTNHEDCLSLPLLVEESKQQVAEEKANLIKLKEKKRESFALYYQTLLECFSCMERMMSYHKLEVQAVCDKVYVDWMEIWCRACTAKAKLTILQLDVDTYTPKTVTALKIIKGHLDKSIYNAERELNSAVQQVTTYDAVGTEFKTLVEQYTVLRKEVDDIKWGLQQFAPGSSS